jgi:uncharacterized repeat protein (TIGR01451 family)
MALLRPVASRIRRIASRITPSSQSNNRLVNAPTRRRLRIAAWGVSAALFAAGGTARAELMAIPGKFAVNAAGAATYTIPIAAPPGIAGMTPSLTLEYNSQAANGILGMGWSLGGLPSIGRCAATIAQDGARGAITYNAITPTDRFCLDGQRLVAISGSYGNEGTEYRTEIDSFSRIISHGSAGTGPAWFEVHTKSGHIMEFGNSPDSRIIAQGTQTARGWAVNKVSDTTGNLYTITYQPDPNGAGQAYPHQISYAGNTINFVYANNRPDTILLYEAGSQQKVTVLLTNVQTNTSAGFVADYRLAYQQTSSTRRSMLTSVTLCDGPGSGADCLPPTNVGWNGNFDGFALGSPHGWSTPGGGTNVGIAQADVNGDGRGDLVSYRFDQSTNTLYAFVMLSNGDGNFSGPYTWSVSGAQFFLSNVTLADVDGDGRADLIISSLDSTGFRVWVALSNGTTFGTPQQFTYEPLSNWGDGAYPDPQGGGFYIINWNLSVVDIDGDGRADLVAYVNGPNGLDVYTARSTSANGTIGFGPLVYNLVPVQGLPWALADINGDGRSDFVANIVNSNGWQIIPALSNGDGTFSLTNGSFEAFDATGWHATAGDLNGDGRTDFLLYRGSASMFQVLLAFSKGDGTFAFQFGTQISGNFNGWALSLADLNGDGRADLVASAISSQGTWLDTFVSNGDGTFTQAGNYFNPQGGYQMFTADIDGDGRSDVIFFAFTGGNFTTITFRTPGQALAATSFTTGLGATTTTGYVSLTYGSTIGVYAKDSGSAYPLQDVQGPLYVVSYVQAPNGVGGLYTTNYAYGGGKLDLSGRGFVGYRTTGVWDGQLSMWQATTFSQVFPYTGLAASDVKLVNNQTLNQTTNSYQFFNAGGTSSVSTPSIASAPYRASLAQSVAQSSDLDGTALPTITTTYHYDAYNNPTQVVTSTPDGYSKTTANTYINDTTNWFLGRLTQAQVTSTAPTPPTPPTPPQPPDMTVTSSHSGAFAQGQTGATYTITVSNVGSGPTSGVVTVEDTLPSGLIATAMAGTGWTCEVGVGSPNCTRSDVLAPAASYPAITLTLNVAANAPSSVTNVATVSGGGEVNTGNDTYSDPTTINPASGGNKVYLTSGTSWTVPSNWNASNNTIEVIGGGGGGSAAVLNTSAGAGGGGGAYSKIANLALTPGGSVTYQVGAAGAASSAGGDTWFNGASLAAASVGAKGGGGAAGTTAGGGGAATSGVGTTKFSGGNGGSGGGGGGGGGGAAGPNGAGGNGATNATGTLGGGGGGGNGGGSAGALPTGGYGGTGGNNSSGTGGGPAGDPTNFDNLDGSAGVGGGGGGGGAGVANMDDGWGGYGGTGSEWSASYGGGARAAAAAAATRFTPAAAEMAGRTAEAGRAAGTPPAPATRRAPAVAARKASSSSPTGREPWEGVRVECVWRGLEQCKRGIGQ